MAQLRIRVVGFIISIHALEVGVLGWFFWLFRRQRIEVALIIEDVSRKRGNCELTSVSRRIIHENHVQSYPLRYALNDWLEVFFLDHWIIVYDSTSVAVYDFREPTGLSFERVEDHHSYPSRRKLLALCLAICHGVFLSVMRSISYEVVSM